MTLDLTKICHAQEIFRALSCIEFNHKHRTDCQQNFLEPLEIVATAIGIKKSFCAGLSAYDEPFCLKLSKFAERFGILFTRTASIEVRIQLQAFAGHKISHSILNYLSNLSITENDKTPRVLWLFTDRLTEIDIRAAADGKSSVGELLGYPKCCTESYMQLEASIIETEMDYFTKYCGATSEMDFISSYKAWTPIEGKHVEQLDSIKSEIQARQALSIRQFPFIHYIACRNCINTSDSPASSQNKLMSDLAYALNPTFARKFAAYANNYYKTFQIVKKDLLL